MNDRITEHAFYQYLTCPSWLYYERQAGGDVREPLMRKLQNEGLLPKKELELLQDRPVKTVELDDVDEAAQRTLELMREGAETIRGGVLIHGYFVGRPDVLERVEGKSAFGDWYYVACDIKRSSHLKDSYKLQGAFYADLLDRVQGVKPVQGYVIHANGNVESFLIDEIFPDYRLKLDDIEAIYDGEQPEPFLTSASKQSPWFEEFYASVRECDHLSLINRVWRSEVRAIEAVGIKTITELAQADEEALEKISGLTADRKQFLQQQAKAFHEKKVVRVAPTDLPIENGPALVIDIESDPLGELHYLIGVLVVDGDQEEYIPFLANTAEEEHKMWQDFLLFMKKYPQTNIYHYGWYEQDVFKRLGEKYGIPDDIKQQFEERMIDVLSRMRESVIFPLPFYSLKDIAKYLGFAWRHAQASGLNSVLWYHDWMNNDDEKALKDIIDYNEDDVRATWLVRNWAVSE